MASGRGERVWMSSSCLVVVLLLTINVNGVQSQPRPVNRGPQTDEAIFDVTKFNATGDGKTDDAMSLIRAWVAACNSGGAAKVLIPAGKNFMAGEVIFAGPCNATKPITIEIQGTISANTDLSSYAQDAWIQISNVDGVVVTGTGTIDGRGYAVWKYGTDPTLPPLPPSVVLRSVQNIRMENLKLVNSMGFHITAIDSKNIDMSKLSIIAPHNSPFTDGIHLSNSTNVKITDSGIATGGDCVSIGHGTQNIIVAGVTCGPGHGLSVGSLGKSEYETSLRGITFKNCTLMGTTHGATIKSYHESAKIQAASIVFEDLVMNGVKNPILINQHVDSKKRPKQSSVRLSDIHFRNIRGTSISAVAINLKCSSLVPCQKIELSNINLSPFNSSIGNLTSSCSNAQIYTQGQIIPPAPTRCI